MKCVFLTSIFFFTSTNADPLADYCNSLPQDEIPWTVRKFQAGRSINAFGDTKDIPNNLFLRRGHISLDRNISLIEMIHDESETQIPDFFDARQEWPECANIIGNVVNQGDAGTCWAISSASVMSDRICIHSNGKTKKFISAEDIIDCCHGCGNRITGGGFYDTFNYWQKSGVVSGGDLPIGNSSSPSETPEFEGCKPYDENNANETKQCQRSCNNNKNYYKDLTFGTIPYNLTSVSQMQLDILKNGPITAGFQPHQDFHCYSSGVYQYVAGDQGDGHAVKIIGWGIENEVPYWLCVNSWGKYWGEDGFFKIVRGRDENGIETRDVLGSLPDFDKMTLKYYKNTCSKIDKK